jgi:hypothetical protein
LRKDYESYLKTGSPKGGLYTCQQQSQPQEEKKEVLIDFSSVALIDVMVQMDRIKHLNDEIEKSRQSNRS